MFQILRWVSLVTRRRRAPEGEITYQPNENGGFVPFNGSSNSSRKTVYLLREYRVTDWSMTFRGNAVSIGQSLQQVGNPMAYAGYSLTLTGVGAPVGVPLATWGNGISTTGSILESVGNQNWDNIGKSTIIFGAEIGGKVLINRLPYQTQTSRTILREGISFKANLIENRYVKN